MALWWRSRPNGVAQVQGNTARPAWRSAPAASGRGRSTAAVAAPPETVKQQQKAVKSIPVDHRQAPSSQPSNNPVLAYFSSALSGITQLWMQQGVKDSSVQLLKETAERAAEAKEEEDRTKGDRKTLPDISKFITPAGMMETRYVRLLSSLCAQTYIMPLLTPKSLFRRFRLKLITSSYACERNVAEVPRTANQVFGDSDAMAASANTAQEEEPRGPSVPPPSESSPQSGDPLLQPSTIGQEQPVSPEEEEITAALAALSNLNHIQAAAASGKVESQPAQAPLPVPPSLAVDPRTGKSAADGSKIERRQREQQLSGAHLVASKLAAAAAAASAAAAAAAAPLASSVSSLASAGGATVASQLQSAASAGTSTAVATFATVSAAIATTLGRGEPPKVKVSPVEWFVADEPESHTRYFVIQGSDNFDHWKVNLTFDPVVFEDPALGVRVHRGVYQTALALYERFLPLVEEHLASSPFAKISFTGHSLGGSLATLLLVMYLRRGVLPAVATSPTYTFGAPAVFCEGNCGPSGCRVPDTADAHEPGQGLLATLGLPEGAVRNVLLARDIVPRAFACDYSLVADILKRVSPSFREHRCLSGGERVVLYYAIGRSLVLQPAVSHWFCRDEPAHPMLPQQPGLYVLQDPSPLASPHGETQFEWPAVTPAAQAVGSEPGLNGSGDQAAAAMLGEAANAAVARAGPTVPSARAALSALMDNPHPLDILGDPTAYGPEGAISRFHNPDNYTAALGGVLRAQPWWTELLRSGATVSPPACSGPRTFFSGAGPDTQAARQDASRRDASAGSRRPPPPDVPMNQVLPYVKPLFSGHANPSTSGHEVPSTA